MLGGGPVGVELAQAWRSLGSEVTLVEAMDRLLPNEEPFASEQVTDALREAGVDVHTGAEATAVRGGERRGDGRAGGRDERRAARSCWWRSAGGPAPRASAWRPSASRRERWLEVDDQLRVGGSDWLYAIGDVNGRALLTHMGKYQARIAGDHVLGKEVAATADKHGSPRVTFTDPAGGGGRLHAGRGRRRPGSRRARSTSPTSGTAGASFHGRNMPGTSRIVVDEERRVLVGATFVGPETADFLHAATIAVVGEVPLERLWHAVPAFRPAARSG